MLEFVADALLMLWRYSWTCGAHRELELSVADSRGNLDGARVGELDGIAHEIEQNLSQTALVAPPERHAFRDGRREAESLRARKRLCGGHDGPDDLTNRIVVESERELTRLDLGEIEYVVDQSEKVFAVGLHARQCRLRLLRQLAVEP